MRTFAFIFARGGSKGVPRKNLRTIGGVSLVGHAIRVACNISEIEKVFVSTDADTISEEAHRHGAFVIRRPTELATDTAVEWLAWQHAIKEAACNYGEFDCFLSLPPTSPLRSKKDVEASLALLKESADAVVTVQESNRSPWFNMVQKGHDGVVRLLSPPNKGIHRRQDAPPTYDMTTVAYASTPTFILNHSHLWDGRVCAVVVPPERALDIDSELDLKIAEFLYNQAQDEI